METFVLTDRHVTCYILFQQQLPHLVFNHSTKEEVHLREIIKNW